MKSYHQGDVNFYPLGMWGKSEKDVAKETQINNGRVIASETPSYTDPVSSVRLKVE